MTVDNNFFCPAPWTSLFVEPNGQVENCCLSKNNIGNVNQTSIIEIINGDNNNKIKQAMLAGEKVNGCSSCYNQTGDQTLRHHFLRQYGTLGSNFYSDTNNFKLKYLDLRWNNTCNLACIYCGPGFSSLWAEQKGQVTKMKSAKNSLLDYALDSVADLNEIYLAGGEPLMLKENEILLNKLLEVNNDCRIIVNTNLNQDLENNKIFNLLKEFNNVQWLVSGEVANQEYEFVRWPGNWDLFYNNIGVINKIANHNISFNMVLMNINALSIWDFIDMLHSDFDLPLGSISINVYNLRNNSGPLSIQRLTDKQREQIKQRMAQKDYSEICGIDNVIDSFNDKTIDFKTKWNGLEATVEYFQELDQIRGTNSREIFPEIYNIVDNTEG